MSCPCARHADVRYTTRPCFFFEFSCPSEIVNVSPSDKIHGLASGRMEYFLLSDWLPLIQYVVRSKKHITQLDIIRHKIGTSFLRRWTLLLQFSNKHHNSMGSTWLLAKPFPISYWYIYDIKNWIISYTQVNYITMPLIVNINIHAITYIYNSENHWELCIYV